MSTATMTAPSRAVSPSNPFAGKASSASGNFEACEAGCYPAHLIAIYDLGTHDEEFKGDPKPDVRKLFLAWETSGEMKSDGKPFVIGKEFSVIVDDNGRFIFSERSNIRLMLEGWRGSKYKPDEDVDPMACLGRACQINVTNDRKEEKVYHKLDKVLPMAKGTSAPARVHEPVAYHISMGEPPVILWLPKVWHRDSSKMLELEEVVRLSKEFTGQPIGKRGKKADTAYSEAVKPGASPAASTTPATEDDDIPF